jgi:hypothetical protein
MGWNPVKSFKKAVKGVVKGVKKAGKGLLKAGKGVLGKFGEFQNKLGPLGTIALMIAIPYAMNYYAATYGTVGAGAVGTTAVGEAAIGTEALAATSSSVGSGAIGISEGIGTIGTSTALTGEAAALGGIGGESLYASTALAETLPITGAPTALGVEMAAYTPEIGAFSAEEALALKSTTGIEALGYDIAGPTSKPFDYGKAARAVGKSLLGGGAAGAAGGFDYSLPEPTPLSPVSTVKGISAGAGAGVGVSKFVEEAQPGLVGRIRQEEERYKSLLARGY